MRLPLPSSSSSSSSSRTRTQALRALGLGFLALAIAAPSCRMRSTTTYAKGVTPGVATVPAGSKPLLPDTAITEPGVYASAAGSRLITLKLATNATGFEWTHERAETAADGSVTAGSSGGGLDLPAPGAPWLVYVETPERFWFSNQHDSLWFVSTSPGSIENRSVITGLQLTGPPPARIPIQELAPLLSEPLRKLLPPVKTETQRDF